ncbi:MAG: hypothetical protein EU533_06815, partial [Promethearchaeota archaeon]
MSIKSIIIQNKLFTILSIGFIAWLALLLSLLTNNHEIIFYDTLAQVDISSSYTSVNPISRYIIEPFFAIALVLEMEFSWMFLYLIFYPVVRGSFLVFKKRNRSEKLNIILIMLKDMTRFTFKIIVSAVLIVLVIVLIGAMIQGFFFINRYFMIPIQIAVHSAILIIFIKFVYLLLRLVHPGLKLYYRKQSKKSKSKRISSSKRFKKVKNELIYYIGIGCLLLGLNIVLISAPFPTHNIIPTSMDDDEFLIDLHVHTVYSDGWLTPEERVVWYINQGIDIAAFSDHDNLRGAYAAQKFVEDNNLDFTVLIAEEWTDHENDIHMNYFGLEEEIVPLESYTPNGPKAMNASDLIQYVKSNGGYITVNHYNYDPNPRGGFGMPYSLQELRDWGVDGFEIVNGGSYSGKYQLIRQFCLDNNLTCVGGSDIHVNEDLNTFIRIRLADPTNKTVENIFQTLQQNLHQVVAIEFAPKLVNFPSELDDLGFYIFEDFINYLFNIDACQAISWISWSSGI